MHTIFIEYTKKVKGCEKVNEKREKRHAGQKRYDRIFFYLTLVILILHEVYLPRIGIGGIFDELLDVLVLLIFLRKSKQGVPKESGLYIITCTELEMSAAAKNFLSEAASIGIIKMPVHYKSHTIPG